MLALFSYHRVYPPSEFRRYITGGLERFEKATTSEDLFAARALFEQAKGRLSHVLSFQRIVRTAIEILNETLRRSGAEGVDKPSQLRFQTVQGVPFTALYHIQEKNLSADASWLAYSFLKFGRQREIRIFSEHLVRNILKDHADDLVRYPDHWIVVNPGGTAVPNAAYLLAKEVSRKLGLQHVSLSAPLALSRRMQNKMASFARDKEFKVLVHGDLDAKRRFSLKGKRVLFIDDGVLTGKLMDVDAEYLKKEGVVSVQPYVVAKLEQEQTENFEQKLDTTLLRHFGIDPLVEILNDRDSFLTTRTINYAFQRFGEDFKRLLESLNPDARWSLYLYALEYFGFKSHPNFKELEKMVERDLKLKIPDTETLARASEEAFFKDFLARIHAYGSRPPVTDAAQVVSFMRALVKKHLRKQNEVRAVFVDLDKTLNFSKPYYEAIRQASLDYLSQQFHITQEEVSARISRVRERASQQGLALRQFNIAAEFGVPYEEYDREMTQRVDATHYISQDAVLVQRLEAWRRQGVMVALLSDSGSRQAEQVLKALGVLEYFDDIFTFDKVHHSKPEPAFLSAALNALQVEPGEAVMVGDSQPLDIAPAQALGMKTVHLQAQSDWAAVDLLVQPAAADGIRPESRANSIAEAIPSGQLPSVVGDQKRGQASFSQNIKEPAPAKPGRILSFDQDVVVVIEQKWIDALPRAGMRELIEIAGLNKTIHWVIPDALRGKYSARVAELRKVAAVSYGFPGLAASGQIPVIGFSDMEHDTLVEFQRRLDPRLAALMGDSAFGLNRRGSIGVGILYALKDIRPDQLRKNRNGFRYDATGRWSAQVVEDLQAYTVISTSA